MLSPHWFHFHAAMTIANDNDLLDSSDEYEKLAATSRMHREQRVWLRRCKVKVAYVQFKLTTEKQCNKN